MFHMNRFSLLWMVFVVVMGHWATLVTSQTSPTTTMCDTNNVGVTCNNYAMTCAELAVTYDFSGDCCILTTTTTTVTNSDNGGADDNNPGCLLNTTSSCNVIERLPTCLYDSSISDDQLLCASGAYAIAAPVSEEECPASEIEVLGKDSQQFQATDLRMILTGINDLSENDIATWTANTTSHILSYYAGNTDTTTGITDVIGYVVFHYWNNTSQTGAGEDQITITYAQLLSWRLTTATTTTTTSESRSSSSSSSMKTTIDIQSLIQDPFLSKEGSAAYISALNAAGIKATKVNVTLEQADIQGYGLPVTSPTVDTSNAAPPAEDAPAVTTGVDTTTTTTDMEEKNETDGSPTTSSEEDKNTAATTTTDGNNNNSNTTNGSTSAGADNHNASIPASPTTNPPPSSGGASSGISSNKASLSLFVTTIGSMTMMAIFASSVSP